MDEPPTLSVDQLNQFISDFLSVNDKLTKSTKTENVLINFISSYNQDTLYVVKSNDQDFIEIYNNISDLGKSFQNLSTFIIFIKSRGKLVSDIPLTKQLNIINIPTSNNTDDDESNDSFEKLRLAINLGLSPYFDLISAANEESALSTTKKKFNELSLALQHLQQRIHIPDLLITTHPQIKKLLESDDDCSEDQIEDAGFLNELTSIANNWIKQIQGVTRLNHEPSDGESITEDIQFWKSMESALIALNQQIESPEVKLTRDILSKAKRFHITLSFENDIGLNSKLNEARLYNSFLKELPINDLVTITEDENFEKFDTAFTNIFAHLKLKLTILPLERAVKSVEILLNDVINKFQNLLGGHDLMSLSSEKFDQLYDLCLKELVMIESNVKYVINLLRELLRKRQEKFKIIKIDQNKFESIKERLQHLKEFRSNHSNIMLIVESVLSGSEQLDSINRLNDAYNKYILPINAVDISHQGKLIWSMNEQKYQKIFHEVNTLAIKKMNNFFNSASTFIDVIAIYKEYFNSKNSTSLLLSMSDEHKLRILSLADREISELTEINAERTDEDLSYDEIEWKIQFNCKLKFYREYLELFLGYNWKSYSLGAKIEATTNKLISSMDPNIFIQNWVDAVQAQSPADTSTLGTVVKVPENLFDLTVNFNFKVFDIYNQLNQLQHLSYTVPNSVLSGYKRIHQLYPVTVGINDHVNLLNRLTKFEMTSAYGKDFGFLVTPQIEEIETKITEIQDIEWVHLLQAVELQKLDDPLLKSADNLIEFQSLQKLTNFQNAIIHLSEQLLKLNSFHEFIARTKYLLKTSAFESGEIETKLKALQHEFNSISLNDVDKLADLINDKVSAILGERLENQLTLFNVKVLGTTVDTDIEITELNKYILEFPIFNHNLTFQDESFFIEPALSEGKSTAFKKINELVAIVENQVKIKPITFTNKKFTSVVEATSVQQNLNLCLGRIESLYEEAESYISQWKSLQNLWELNLQDPDDFNKIFNKEENVSTWFDTVRETFTYRQVYDQPEPIKKFGSLFSIDFSKIQNRVSMKFDVFEKQVLLEFANKVHSDSSSFNRSLINAKETLEIPIHFHEKTETLTSNIDNYLKFFKCLSEWKVEVETYANIQKFLTRQRYKFSIDWIYVEQLENNLSMVQALLERKKGIIEENIEVLGSKLISETAKINDSIKLLNENWKIKRPIAGNLNPSVAMMDLDNSQKQYGKLDKSMNSISNICLHFGISVESFEDISLVTDEIKDLKTVWSSVNVLWEELERLKSLKWSDLQTRQLHHQLDDLLNSARNLPINIRQYAAVDEIQSSVKNHLKNHQKLSDLKNGSMKPRHWKFLLSQLGVSDIAYDRLTVGDVWSLNIALNIQTINSMLEQANNERTIEENLNNINISWSSITFELFNYENKCRLVKNWEQLFDQCNTDINALTSMKNSPYFNSFEREISELEKKLNQLFVILDIWIDVQRQWLYLDGVFGNDNNDIKNLLPIESSRFTNISYEFLSLLKRIYKFNLVIDVVLLGDLQPMLTKFLESLTKVRKSLTDYLEKQRELFPRFYFIGNEDLLDLIGGSNDIVRINNHLKKMFSGIDRLNYMPESSSITGVVSEQGEELTLQTPISLIKYNRLNEWLRELELEMKLTLSYLIKDNLQIWKADVFNEDKFLSLIDKVPAQVATLLQQITFSSIVQEKFNSLPDFHEKLSQLIRSLTRVIGSDITDLTRKKIQYLIIEIIHQRDVVGKLAKANEKEREFFWSVEQKFYYNLSEKDALKSLIIKQANVEFTYGFEYLGIPEKLAYTPLTNDCYLAMCQALSMQQGGSPFGPAGTGKTETVKALGHNLGKMVIVFCCDESFDFQSMGRIFLGLCKVGIWGCFDEFNRLDDKSLSAISSQIENIEYGLKYPNTLISVSERNIKVNPETGLFITMNPGYAGRVELPENLKKLFRSFSMNSPDSEIIVEILLTSQTFEYSKELAAVIVPFFKELSSNCSSQLHYDFGLRALKNTLVRCGRAKRAVTSSVKDVKFLEYTLVLQSIVETVLPKLIKEDEIVFNDLKTKYFANVDDDVIDKTTIIVELTKQFSELGIESDDNFINKALQLIDIQNTHHGLMLVGESGAGKSTILKSVMKALSAVDNVEHVAIIIDAKVLSKDEIYGKLDVITGDWTDGLFSSILRRIKENLRGELSKRIWIVFDGDIDPQWAENLNSVLDDNKILTLPNGERLTLPENVRIVFEVDNLNHTTPATISRCGIVWFDVSLIPIKSHYYNLISQLKKFQVNIDDNLGETYKTESIISSFVESLNNVFSPEMLSRICGISQQIEHIMDFSVERAISSFEILLKTYLRRVINHSVSHDDKSCIEMLNYVSKALILSIMWTFSGDASNESRIEFQKILVDKGIIKQTDLPNGDVFDYDVSLPECEWFAWNNEVAIMELEPHQVSNPNTIVPTLDTVKHENFIYSILNEHSPLLLCGPPGSGKTMTLFESLRKSPQLELVSLNFSKETSPISLLKSLEQFCEYRKTNRGIELSPRVSGKWVVLFCDEINLPQVDNYGTQNVISLIRQMIEHKGFWRTKDNQWVSLVNIQFVGACNSPKDPGRNKLSERFLRHVPVIMVDYPGHTSMTQIYQTFNLAILKCAPDLRGFAKAITQASIEVYEKTKEHFNPTIQKHYVYSPRELTRWSRGLLEALKSNDYKDLNSFLRLWYHEALRLFYDRLVSVEDRAWTVDMIKEVATKNFPNVDIESVCKDPVFFSNWMSLNYKSIDEKELRSFVSQRLRVFSEEEIEVDLVLHDEMLDYALRIDRVLRQPQGHMILVGPSASGKSTLAKFVAWINGLKIVLLNVRNNYTISDFDQELREILLRCVNGEKICFIIDESSILEVSFIERMNTLLANAEIPGLFEGDDYTSLLNKCLELSHAQGLLLDTETELYNWFAQQISQNLHVVFSISDSSSDPTSQSVISSPALFNRCVLSWMGDWSNKCLYEVASSRINTVPLDISNYIIPNSFSAFLDRRANNLRDVVVDILSYMHRFIPDYNSSILYYHRTPNDFLKLVQQFIQLFNLKQLELEESQRHITGGLDKLRETVIQVDKLQLELGEKEEMLKIKDKEAKQMLNKLLTDQNEAERKQEFSIVTQSELEKQEKEIEMRKSIVLKDLELAEPAVLEAQRGVQNIKKQHLSEIRSMMNPPAAVKMTMESVCILLGYDVNTWRDVQLVIRRDDFIPNIVSFDCQDQLSVELREFMERTYLTRDDYTFELVHRASKACGPLLQWVKAQLTYSRILQSVGPLREEVQFLEQKTMKTKAQLIAIDEMIFELEESIENYKESYSKLIRDTENIKMEMTSVDKKIERSMKLIKNLTKERERWKESVKTFGDQRDKLVGETLLVSGFIVYGGLFDQKGRELLLKSWKLKMKDSGIKFNEALSLSNYLSHSREIVNWVNCGLVNDDLNIENFALLKWSEHPVIIDPSGAIVDILVKSFSTSTKQISVTSFLSDGLINQLENALRFGGIIIIQDCEYYDPILDNVLRKEIHRNGGRSMIKLGDQIIDYSTDFKLILCSKEPKLKLPPSVSSRTTIVNFTITSGSLENRTLDIALKEIRPDVEQQRAELMVLNGEWKLRLQALEEELLESLSKTPGEILDNDDVMKTLETLKIETDGLNEKINHSTEVMSQVEEIRNNYQDVATNVSKVFSVYGLLSGINHFYNFSLSRFINNFTELLKKNSTAKPGEIIVELFKDCYARASTSLQYNHKIIFAMLLTTAYYVEDIGTVFQKVLLKVLQIVDQGDEKSMNDAFELCLARNEPGWDITKILSMNQDNLVLGILSDLIMMITGDKKDEFIDSFSKITKILFNESDTPYSSPYDLKYWTIDQSINSIILTCPDIFDASYKVEQVAESLGEKLVIISMGSKEGVEIANNELERAIGSGKWILIQNIHMAPLWVSNLENKLVHLHENSRVFMTCKNNSVVPIGLISRCKVLNFENEVGIKQIISDTYKSIGFDGKSKIEKHLIFLLVIYHAIVVDRLRYVPVSYVKKYDFNDSDFTSGVVILEKTLSKNKSIPWEEIRYLISRIIYGGKVENETDLMYLETLAQKIFNEESSMTTGKLEIFDDLQIPDFTNTEEIENWISDLPHETPLKWIEMPENANLLVKKQLGLEITEKLIELVDRL
ncbi:ro-1 Dynein heavy chain [Candida maltosa Xu316]|uniref:Dynein heavy chain, cytoplasmic n=1 Tax=Candida maltosa (strain Xu316) TaxID=1245528 RepID=M3HE27_CANMX|nr:Cytoplasmic dynein heavy chain [Candida maltosa Xu316]